VSRPVASVFWQGVAVRSSTQETLQLSGLAEPGVREARVLRCAFECFARTVFRTYVRLEVGARDILPAGSFLLCSNHASHLDGAALMVASGLPFDSFRLLAAADYFSPESRAGRLTRAMFEHRLDRPVQRTGGPLRSAASWFAASR